MGTPRTTLKAKLTQAFVTVALAAVAVVSVGHSSAMLGADAADRQVAAAATKAPAKAATKATTPRVPPPTICPRNGECGGGRRN
jgi:hypothetical protein